MLKICRNISESAYHISHKERCTVKRLPDVLEVKSSGVGNKG